MIRVSVLYPNHEGHAFDMAYYCDRHIPMVQQLFGSALKAVAVEQGIGGAEPDRHRHFSLWVICRLSRWKPFKQPSQRMHKKS